MALPLVLTGCGDDDSIVATSMKKAMTITLYGITNESTTEEAVKEVQDALNAYTEGQYNTHVILHLYTEDKYYEVIEEKLQAIEDQKAFEEAEEKRKKEEAKKRKEEGLPETKAPETAPAEIETKPAETFLDRGVIRDVYPDEKDLQLDVFMVQGFNKLQEYINKEYLSTLDESLGGTSKTIKKYITSDLLATTTVGGNVFGIPSNYIYGEYTYLLVKKEIADRYGYSAADVDTLNELQYFLMDAKRDYPDHITLYNDPVCVTEYLTSKPSLLGYPLANSTTLRSNGAPKVILNYATYTAYINAAVNWPKLGYITKGDYHNIPDDTKFAAAFIKGDITAAKKYEEDYYVINFLNPVSLSNDRPGTVFCIGKNTLDATRCGEIITALQTKAEFINTFAYGVKGVHYTVDDDTGLVTRLNKDYSMDYKNIGNLFLLTPCDDMSEEMLKLAKNNWAEAKQHSLDTIDSPFTGFSLKKITKDNYKETSAVYKEAYDKAVSAAKTAAFEAGETFDESTFTFKFTYPYEYTDKILEEVEKLSDKYLDKLNNFKEGAILDEYGDPVDFKDYVKMIRKEFEAEDWYKIYADADNPDSPLQQYNAWYQANRSLG